jgi:hypothetical protein
MTVTDGRPLRIPWDPVLGGAGLGGVCGQSEFAD